MSFPDEDFFADTDLFDPLRIERSTPLEDEEAAFVESLCQEATPGPLLIDDDATGEGFVVATLPDGRHVISLACDSPADSRQTAEADAQLICRSRYLLLRLLRDRLRWQREREALLERVTVLEVSTEIADRALDELQRIDEQKLPLRSR